MPKFKAIYYPRLDGDVPPFYAHAVEELTTGGMATKYGILPADVLKIEANSTNIPVVLQASNDAAVAAKEATSVKNEDFATSKFDLLNVFTAINRSPLLDEADAVALGMRQGHTPPDPTSAQPVISKVTSLHNKIIIDWVKGAWNGVNVYASYDNITFEKLDKDNRSPFEDKRLNKVAHVPEKRYYKLCYFDTTGEEIGLMSLVSMVITDIYAV